MIHRRPAGFVALFHFALIMIALFTVAVPAAFAAPGVARIHYHRDAGDSATWQLYTWTGAAAPSPNWVPAQSPSGSDAFGSYFDVALNTSAAGLNFILHDATGNSKNCPNDMLAPFPANVATQGMEIWQLQDDCRIYSAVPPFAVGDVGKAKAQFLDRTTIAWLGAVSGRTYRLYYAPSGGITSSQSGVAGGQSVALQIDPAGLPADLRAKFPNIATALALKLPASLRQRVPALLRGQLVVAQFDGNSLIDATALQTPGVLDDIYSYRGPLGAIGQRDPRTDDQGDDHDHDHDHDDWDRNGRDGLSFRVWAPTAQSVRVHVFDSATGPATRILPMSFDARSGVWHARGDDAWLNRAYYAYEVQVYVRSTGKVETNLVADPYALGAAPGNARSLIVDLNDRRTQPPGWDRHDRPRLESPLDIALYELHIRDFSASDMTVPAADRGKYRAFGYAHSDGMEHLRSLRDAGLTHVHLLPAFEIASVADSGCITPVIPAAAPDSTAQQAALAPVRDQDCFNWGYDPVLYTVPGASYASTPVGTARIVEFRQMVQSLHDTGLRVVMDVVYNHTTASGQDTLSILDKIVPGYYYRLDANGAVQTDTCCQDTAAEHAMMGKLLVDSVVTWARQYKVDGFRFDLMGFHPKALMVELKQKLARIDPSIYVYGEGWNFGAIANDARFVQATQANMAGTGIGTFNDRLRDGVRGGSPFDGGAALVANQGFINGLWYDPNALAGAPTEAQRQTLNQQADWIRLGLTGSLKDYVFTDRNGNTLTGSQIDYNGQPAGYTLNPADVINYVSAHDNYTLFDNDQFKMPQAATMADRVRVNSLGMAIVALSQGVPFFHAGDDLLRSKSMDNNSFNSGDWFNKLDLSYQSNNWGVGLPPAFAGNDANWPVMQPLLADATLKPGPADIAQAHAVFEDWLKIRQSSPLLRLRSGTEVKQRVRFYNVGPAQVPGLIVMSIDDRVGRDLDRRAKSLVAVINVTNQPVSYVVPGYRGRRLVLHPVQASGADPVVKAVTYAAGSGTVSVPARTAAVLLEMR